MGLGTVTLALLAGLLSTLSPCVLPLLPIVLGTAASEHRYGPVALAAGLTLSFAAVGMFIATIGFSLGLTSELFRYFAAALLIAIGAVLLVPRLQAQLAVAAGPASSWAHSRLGDAPASGLKGQFGVGLLLGAVWSPCVGPTLGAASVLAARGESLGWVGLTMLAFGVGAAIPLLVIGLLSRDALMRWRGRMMSFGNSAKTMMGALLLATGIMIVAGLDKRLEATLVGISPQWLIDLTTRF